MSDDLRKTLDSFGLGGVGGLIAAIPHAIHDLPSLWQAVTSFAGGVLVIIGAINAVNVFLDRRRRIRKERDGTQPSIASPTDT